MLPYSLPLCPPNLVKRIYTGGEGFGEVAGCTQPPTWVHACMHAWVGWLVGRLVGQLVGWLVGWMYHAQHNPGDHVSDPQFLCRIPLTLTR